MKQSIDSTAISNEKQEHHQLIVDDLVNGENGVAALAFHKMQQLSLCQDDIVILKGANGSQTVSRVKFGLYPFDHIQMDRTVRGNLRDIVSIQGCQDMKYGEHIHVLPIEDTVKSITGSLMNVYLQPYCDKYENRPIHEGDTFIVRAAMHNVQFKVIKTKPSPYCIVTKDTIIQCQGDLIKRGEEEKSLNETGYDDIGGVRK